MLQDLAYAARSLRASPVFAVTAIATIALGIGASTAIFSVTDAVLLRPLPYGNPDRLLFACADMRKRNVSDFPFSSADYIDLRDGSKSVFQAVGAVNTQRGSLPRDDGTPEPVRFGFVTPHFFRLLGTPVSLGRDFTEADGQPNPQTTAGTAPPLPTMVILSHGYWQRRYGGNPAVLGQTIRTGPQTGSQIVGVLPAGFELLFPPAANMETAPDLWVAARIPYDLAQRNNTWLRVVARLRDDVTPNRAQAEVEHIAAAVRRSDTTKNSSGFHIRLEPMRSYIVAQVRPAILALMGAVTFLLLIACANVANLLLVRASLRERELAVRIALGGSRWRLMHQMLAESLLLAGAGTLLGLILAWAGIHAVLRIAPANLPRATGIGIHPSVVAFSAGAGFLAAALFGIVPALRASRTSVMLALRAAGRTAGLGGGSYLRDAVVIAEVALSFVLLIGSGLMFRSFLALQQVDPGFDPHGVLVFRVMGARPAVPAQRAAMMHDLRDRLRAIPGVEGATAASPFPLAGGFTPVRWGREEALTDPSKYKPADFEFVLPGYFETMRAQLIAGRTFTDADNTPDRRLAMIDDLLAAKAFPNGSAIGQRILTRINTPEAEWVEVIGVVRHQREVSLAGPDREQIYFTDGLGGYSAANTWAIRTAGDATHYIPALRAELARMGMHLAIAEARPMESLVADAQAGTRFSLMLIGAFALIAALLAGVGLYGVLSTVVRQRTAEIGVRMAIGAAPGNIFQLIVGQGLRLSAAGIALGLLAALALTRVMTSMLVGVTANDPGTFALMGALFFGLAAFASWLPARRAAHLDPNAALRNE